MYFQYSFGRTTTWAAMMVEWSHGYNVSGGYTHGFYHEMAPDWLDLCVGLAGYVAPRREPGAGFRYLDLGTGQGLGLCLLAAANPQGEFIGVDFLPEHIAHATDLAIEAGLTNVRFVEADFNDLAADWPRDFGQFDYVALHGIYSWVPPQVRVALQRCLSHATRPGAIIYNSYNTQPGWLSGVPIQHLAQRIQKTTGRSGRSVMKDAVDLLVKCADADASVFKAMPGLRGRLDRIKTQDASYLIQEYLHEEWKPFWHSEVAQEFRQAKLDYIGPATVSETLLPRMLPAAQRDIVNDQEDPGVRQDILDVIINQSFRRDIFCRGPRRTRHSAVRSATRLHLLAEPAAGADLEIKTTFGTAKIGFADIAEIIGALRSGPKSIEELEALPKLPAGGGAKVLRNIILLLQNRTLGCAAASPGDGAACYRLNTVLARAKVTGAPYRFLAAGNLGSAFSPGDADFALIDAWLSSSGKADSASLAAAVKKSMDQTGRKLTHEGKTLEGIAADKRLAVLAEGFLKKGVSHFRKLGALP